MTNLPIGDFANAWYWSVMFIISQNELNLFDGF
jgi:hypothetical protein